MGARDFARVEVVVGGKPRSSRSSGVFCFYFGRNGCWPARFLAALLSSRWQLCCTVTYYLATKENQYGAEDYLIPEFPEPSPRARILRASQVVEKGAMQLFTFLSNYKKRKRIEVCKILVETYLPI